MNSFRKNFVSYMFAFVAICALCGCQNSVEESIHTQGTTIAAVEETQVTVVETEAQQSGLKIEAIKIQGDYVVVSTTIGDLRYPFALEELIQVEAQNDGENAALLFTARLGEKVYSLFTLHFGGETGVELGTLQIEGKAMPVYAELAPAPDVRELGENQESFLAAQEAFNDIVTSLMENPDFVAA